MKTIFTVLSLALGTFIASPAEAQEVLPFPPHAVCLHCRADNVNLHLQEAR
jgi:hypothetical protein